MTDLINSLKAFASSSSAATISIGNQISNFHQPLMTLGRADSCTESGFNQWRDAMRMVARLPGGLPTEFRTRLWENLADRYLQVHHIDWSRIANKCLTGNCRDQEISDQIEKDLHRTGCTGFNGANQAVLKRVLVSYSRWNPGVGYCQGFNMIGAMLLQMTNGNERLTLKIFIFLIEGVLPEGYFGQGLCGLAVDMAVFREILKFRKPTLNAHLNSLQKRDNSPPLTDVFTMHWFLTLFIHCLPPQTVLRIWDLILLEGSEILLRTSLVLWAAIETRILCVSNTDEFYSVMGVVTREMLEFGLLEPNALMKCVVSVGPFPFPGLEELRQRQRALISQDTPCKSFFLAKRELDTLKRHYAAMRHRQRATTIIFKGLDANTNTKPARSLSLLVVPTKRQVVASPRPKIRRQISNNAKNHNNSSSSPLMNHKGMTGGPGSNPKNGANNSINNVVNLKNHNNNNNNNGRTKQITVGWDKSLKNKFRKRRSSASSHTSTSSSTELCDSSSDDNDDHSGSSSFRQQTVWIDPAPSPTPTPVNTTTTTIKNTAEDLKLKNEDDEAEKLKSHDVRETKNVIKSSSSTEDSNLEKANANPNNDESELDKISTISFFTENGESSDTSTEHKTIDTNDSQHFLDEMSKLGKSDSFYENLSQRICELQFQNLTVLTTCNNTTNPADKENNSLFLSVEQQHDYYSSPLPSPISPIQSFYEPQDFSKLSLSPYLTPHSLSPRGSISSGGGESPLPRSPLSPSPDPNFTHLTSSPVSPRKNSKSSVSSIEFNNDGIKESNKKCKNNQSIDTISLKSNESIVVCTDDNELKSSITTHTQVPTINYESDKSEGDKSPSVFQQQQHNNEIELTEKVNKINIDEVSSRTQNQILRLNNDELEISSTNTAASKSDSETTVEPSTSTGYLTNSSNHHHHDTITYDNSITTDGQTSEDDINTVIRENIAILQRLKMKPAYGSGGTYAGDDYDYFDYYSTDDSSDDDEAFTSCNEKQEGGPVTETNATAKTTTSSVTSNGNIVRKTSISSRTRSRSNSSSSKSCVNKSNSICSAKTIKPKKSFNPFPTTRRPRVKSTKFGLYG